MCAALSSYARACAAKGVMLWGWREHVCSEYRAAAGLPVPAVPPWQLRGEGWEVTSQGPVANQSGPLCLHRGAWNPSAQKAGHEARVWPRWARGDCSAGPSAGRVSRPDTGLGAGLQGGGAGGCPASCGPLPSADKDLDSCPKSQVFLYNLTACQQTCRSLSESDTHCLQGFAPVDGCGCPDHMYLDEKGRCVPLAKCSCYYRGLYLEAGEVVLRQEERWWVSWGGGGCAPSARGAHPLPAHPMEPLGPAHPTSPSQRLPEREAELHTGQADRPG